MANVADDRDPLHAEPLGRRYLIQFDEDTLRQRPLCPIRGEVAASGMA